MDYIIKNKFDFDIGYLIKSPCKECLNNNDFPKCIDKCELIDDIQLKLAGGISTFRNIQNYPS